MRIVNKKDVLSALATGLTTGVISWRILAFLGKGLPMGVPPVVLVFIIPVAWVAGVQLGYFLSSFFRPFAQFGKFACIGFANAMVDFGVLYVLIGYTGLAEGSAFSLFKAISFSFATVHSYLWNKYWAFDAARTSGGSTEAVSFIGVSLASLLVNVAAASVVVSLRPETVAVASWAGVGAIVGSAVALIFSFTGFRVFVFKKK